jgi:hypothetical protein
MIHFYAHHYVYYLVHSIAIIYVFILSITVIIFCIID